jgi:hypothetical protein
VFSLISAAAIHRISIPNAAAYSSFIELKNLNKEDHEDDENNHDSGFFLSDE